MNIKKRKKNGNFIGAGTPLIERGMWLRIHFIFHTCTSAACAGAWNGEWHGAGSRGREGDNRARTITMTEPRATVYSELLIREFRFAACVPFRKSHGHVVCTLLRELLRPRHAPSRTVVTRIAWRTFVNPTAHPCLVAI